MMKLQKWSLPKFLKTRALSCVWVKSFFVYIYVRELLKINWDILQILRIYLSEIDSNWAALSLAGSKEL